MDKITKDFFNYLCSLDISDRSLRFYKSDLSHITGWFIFKVKTYGVIVDELTQIVPFLNKKLALEYKNYLVDNSVSSKTINRRLSTLRHLGRFLLVSQILPYDFALNLSNIPAQKQKQISYEIIKDFKRHLEEKRVSQNTIKNYLSDIRQFLTWLETNYV